jgi:hypothetical protein
VDWFFVLTATAYNLTSHSENFVGDAKSLSGGKNTENRPNTAHSPGDQARVASDRVAELQNVQVALFSSLLEQIFALVESGGFPMDC